MLKTLKKVTIIGGFVLAVASSTAQEKFVNTGHLQISPETVLSTLGDFDNKTGASLMNNGELYAYANWHNNGAVDHTQNGTTNFVGDQNQQITGPGINYLYNVGFNNPTAVAAFNLAGDVSVANNVHFAEGIVNNRDHGGSFVFERNAAHTGTANNSHVHGTVQKEGDEAFTFPVGDNGFYRRAIISAPANQLDLYTCTYHNVQSGQNYPVANVQEGIRYVDPDEHWVIERAVGAATVMVSLSWSDQVSPTELLNGGSEDISVLYWDPQQNLWVNLGGVVNDLEQTVTTVAEVDSFGVFTLGKVALATEGLSNAHVYNGMTVNGDTMNSFFRIENIENYPNNNLKIYNRWGAKVFDMDNYGNGHNAFNGIANVANTIRAERKLPTGTYFYVLQYEDPNGGNVKHKSLQGYLYLKTDH